MNLTVNPKFAMYWSIAVSVLSFIGAGVLPSFVPPGIGKEIAETATWIVGVLAAVQAGLHGLSAPQAGPLVSAQAANKTPTP